jgi:uncharacterized Rmd1/YagE family protein
MKSVADDKKRLATVPEYSIPTRKGLAGVRAYDSDTLAGRDISSNHRHHQMHSSAPIYSSNDEDSAVESSHRYDSDNNEQEDVYRNLGFQGMFNDNMQPMYSNLKDWQRSDSTNAAHYQESDSSGDEFDNYKFFYNMIKTGRQRKKLSSRSRGGEFMMKRKKRRVYFCSLAKEIDVERLHDAFSEGHMNMVGKLYIDVLYLYENKVNSPNTNPNQQNKYHEAANHRKTLSTTEESSELSQDAHREPRARRRSSDISIIDDPSIYQEDATDKKARLPIETAGKLWQSGGKEAYVFNFGAVVFWGYNRGEELSLLNEIKKYILNGALTLAEFDRCDDDMAFVVSPTEAVTSIANDVITCPEDADIKSRLSVSFAIAQSSVLSLFESRIDTKIQEYKYIPETLALSGRVKLSQKELGNMIGDVLSIRHDVNLNSEIMSTPDFFWREDEAVITYRMTMAYLEMDSRTEVLNTRITMLRDLLVVLQHQSETILAVQLEWVIIWLIVISIVLEALMSIMHQ